MKRRIAVLFLCFAFVSGMAQAAVPPVWIHAGHLAGHHVAHVILPKIVSLKGVTGAPLAGVIVVRAAFAACALAAIWHIPAWEKAKANGTEAQYQAKEMWPQSLFDKLPGGTPGRLNYIRLPQPGDNGSQMGNGGNFEGGMSN